MVDRTAHSIQKRKHSPTRKTDTKSKGRPKPGAYVLLVCGRGTRTDEAKGEDTMTKRQHYLELAERHAYAHVSVTAR